MPSGESFEYPTLRVQTRAAWTDEWTTRDNIHPIMASAAVGPAMGSAKFMYHYGDIERESDSSTQVYPALSDLKNHYIRIVHVTNPGGSEELKTLFCGVIRIENVALLARNAGKNESGNQEFTAYDLSDVLDRRPIRTAFAEAQGMLIDIDVVPKINERDPIGFGVRGNRSAQEHTINDELAYAFAGNGAAKWKLQDVIYYLVAAYGGGLPFVVLAPNALAQIDAPEISMDGKTARMVINELIDRRRGFYWYISYRDSDGLPLLFIDSIFEDEITIGGVTVSGNSDPQTYAMNDQYEIENSELKFDGNTLYNTVVARGARVVSCFSVSVADGTMQAGWTPDEQTAYGAIGGDADVADERRTDDAYQNVYARFLLKPQWQYGSGNGEGGAGGTTVPKVLDDGTIDTAQSANIRDWGTFLLRSLPIEKTFDDPDGFPEYLEPLAIIKDPNDKWHHVENMTVADLPAATIRMLDNELGMQIDTTGPAHTFGLNHFTGTNTEFDAELDWEQLIFTVAVELDQRLKVIETISEPTPNEPARELLIDDLEAQLWIVVPNTVIGLTAAGALERQPDGYIVRDDSERLRQMAALAKEWYSKVRTSMTIDRQGIRFDILAGAMLTVTTAAWTRDTITALVTNVSYDFLQNRTGIKTGFKELEFLNIV